MASSLPNNRNPKIDISITIPEVFFTATETPAAATENSAQDVVMISDNKDEVVSISDITRSAAAMSILSKSIVRGMPILSQMILSRDSSSNPKHLLQGERGKYKQLGCIPSKWSRKSRSEHSDKGTTDNQNESENPGDDEADQNEEAGDNAEGGDADLSSDVNDDDSDDDEGNESGMRIRKYVIQNNIQIDFVEELSSHVLPQYCVDWNDLARDILLFRFTLDPDVPDAPELEDATPYNCWPGSVTIFGNVTVTGETTPFRSLNWTDHNFMDVRAGINCLLAIEI